MSIAWANPSQSTELKRFAVQTPFTYISHKSNVLQLSGESSSSYSRSITLQWVGWRDGSEASNDQNSTKTDFAGTTPANSQFFMPSFLSSDELSFTFDKLDVLDTKQHDAAIASLSTQISHNSMLQRGAIRFIFDKLVASKRFDESPYFDAIVRLFSPYEIYEVASQSYRRFGLDRRLSLAAAMLHAKGRESWPVLEAIAARKQPECEHFVGLITSLEGVNHNRRLKAIRDLADNKDIDVRILLVHAMYDIEEIRDNETLRILALDENIEIREYAEEMILSTV